jgi:hypothetical protein
MLPEGKRNPLITEYLLFSPQVSYCFNSAKGLAIGVHHAAAAASDPKINGGTDCRITAERQDR